MRTIKRILSLAKPEVLVLSMLLAAACSPSQALPLILPKSAIPAPVSPFIAEGEPGLSPLPHIRFCMKHPEECRSMPDQASTLGADSFAILGRVNSQVNVRIRPRVKDYVIGQWTISPTAGDCNDYAVTKRHELIAHGLPAAALRLAVVETAWGEGHLVLVARIETGDYVLDNLNPRVRLWSQTGYRFLKLQAIRDATTWVAAEVAEPVDDVSAFPVI